jgi:hypothetical protein
VEATHGRCRGNFPRSLLLDEQGIFYGYNENIFQCAIVSPGSIWLTTKLKAAMTIGNSLRGYHLKEDLEELFGNVSTHFWLTYLFPHTHHTLLLVGGHNQHDRTQQKVKTVVFQKNASQVLQQRMWGRRGRVVVYDLPVPLLPIRSLRGRDCPHPSLHLHQTR